jgi:hypothetical protein
VHFQGPPRRRVAMAPPADTGRRPGQRSSGSLLKDGGHRGAPPVLEERQTLGGEGSPDGGGDGLDMWQLRKEGLGRSLWGKQGAVRI